MAKRTSRETRQQTDNRLARYYCLIIIVLTITTLSVYLQVKDFEFIDFDDTAYVTENPHLQGGFRIKNIVWAFTSGYQGNWHPLTWISHMLDCQVFGFDSTGHHMVSVCLHLINALLLFILLEQMSGALWRSSLVAALFALHPLHVESVAWVAERKDVLSALFWLLSLCSYAWYVKQPGTRRYGLTALFFVMGLMAKPMVVTLPFVMLLLDVWPLGRIGLGAQGANTKKKHETASHTQELSTRMNRHVTTRDNVFLLLMIEKLPLFALAAASCAITFIAQHREGTFVALDVIPLSARFANALVSYVLYLEKTFYPLNLAVFYPHPQIIPVWQAAIAALVLLTVTGLALILRKKSPYVLTGWLWFIGTMVPVIGIVQVGTQAMADRYTYIPLIGIFIIISWGCHEMATRLCLKSTLLVPATCIVVIVLAGLAGIQVSYWKNSITLFEHAGAVTKDNFIAHSKVGFNLLQQGRLDEALPHYYAALRIRPRDSETYNSLGVVLFRLGRLDGAIRTYRDALEIAPNCAEIYFNLGIVLREKGETQESLQYYTHALRLKPDYPEAHNNLGRQLTKLAQFDEACVHLREAVRLKPNYAEAYNNLGIARMYTHNADEAIACFKTALSLKPDYKKASDNLRQALLLAENRSLDRETDTLQKLH